MKKKTPKLILAVMIVATIILSACSGGSNSSPSGNEPQISSEASSTSTEPIPIMSDAESSDIASSSLNEDDEDVEEPKKVRIDADGGLRIRSGPSVDYDIIKVIPQNVYAEVITGEEDNPDWLYVSYDGDNGWISKEFISHELGTVPWAKVYHNYLAEYEFMTYTYFDGEYEQWGHTVDGERRISIWVQFMNYPGYDYPILVSTEGWPDTGVPDCVDIIFLIESGKVIEIRYDNPRRKEFFNFDELSGKQVAFFPFKDDFNGSKPVPENMQKALAWLETQM